MNIECLMRCECADGYYQKNDQCIKESISPIELYNSVRMISFSNNS